MGTYITRRLLQAIPMLFIISILLFVLVNLAPGGPMAGYGRKGRGQVERMERLKAQQGQILETVAIDELSARREQLEAYQNQARFAFADSYDRAAKAQAR